MKKTSDAPRSSLPDKIVSNVWECGVEKGESLGEGVSVPYHGGGRIK
jgi:hypothetical protein